MNELQKLQERILSEGSLRDVLEHYGCKDNGKDSNMGCNRHKSENKMSIAITNDKVCECKSPACDIKGNIYSIIALYEGYNKNQFYTHTLKTACDILGYPYKEVSEEDKKKKEKNKQRSDIIKKSHKIFFEFTKQFLSSISNYIKEKRKITQEELDNLKLGVLPEEQLDNLKAKLKKEIPEIDNIFFEKDGKKKLLLNTYYSFKNRIIHPHYIGDDIVYLTGEATERIPKNKDGNFDGGKYVKLNAKFSVTGHAEGYFLNNLDTKNKDYIIISEGYWDALKLKLCDIPLISFGTCAISKHFIETSHKIKQFKKIVICFDSEENKSGILGAISLAKRLHKQDTNNIFIGELPTVNDKKVDIDEYLNRFNSKEDKQKAIQDTVINGSRKFIDFMFEEAKNTEDDKHKDKVIYEIVKLAEQSTTLDRGRIIEKLKKELKINKEQYKRIVNESKEDNNISIEEQLSSCKSENNLRNILNNFIEDGEYSTANWFCGQYLLNTWKWHTRKDSKAIFMYINGVYEPEGDMFIEPFTQKVFRGNITEHIVKEVIGNVRRSSYIEPEEFNEVNDEICVKNGVLNLKTGDLTAHTPDKIFLNKFPINYDKNAKCENIINFIHILLDKKYWKTVQKWFGYCLVPTNKYKRAVILEGEHNTGKTTFINLINKFIGRKNLSHVSLQKICDDKHGVAHLYGVKLNTDDDLKFTNLMDVGNFKKVTGDGEVSGEHKYGREFNFTNTSKLMFACNQIPQTDLQSDDAYYGRWLIFPFMNQIVNIDREMISKITTKEEMEGLLVWAVKGLKMLEKDKDFSYDMTIEETMKYFQRSGSNIAEFAQNMLEEEENNKITKKDMHIAYCKYIKDMKLKTKKGKYKEESIELVGRTLTKYADYIVAKNPEGGDRYWKNVKILLKPKNMVVKSERNLWFETLEPKHCGGKEYPFWMI